MGCIARPKSDEMGCARRTWGRQGAAAAGPARWASGRPSFVCFRLSTAHLAWLLSRVLCPRSRSPTLHFCTPTALDALVQP